MEILTPISAAVAIAANAVTAGFALRRLCEGCAKAEEYVILDQYDGLVTLLTESSSEVSQASQTMEVQKINLQDWEMAWKSTLGRYQRDRSTGLNSSAIWGKERLAAIQRTLSNIQKNYKEVGTLLASCVSPKKPKKTFKRNRKVPLFIRLFYPGYTIRIGEKRRKDSRNDANLIQKIEWCTFIRKKVYDLLDMIRKGQEDLGSISTRAFDLYLSTDRSWDKSVLVEKLTVAKAFVRFRQALGDDPKKYCVVGHALIREREKIRDDEAHIRLAFIAVPQTHYRSNDPMALFAEVTLDTSLTWPTNDLKVTFCALPDLDVSTNKQQSLADIKSNDDNIDDFETVLKKLQMALTICKSIFELCESGCLSANLSIAHIFGYQHRLLSVTERSQVLYQKQLYIRIRDRQDCRPRPTPTPFDYMHERTPDHEIDPAYYTKDNLLHRVGIILFEIGHGLGYEKIFGSDTATHQKVNDSLDDIDICQPYINLVRQCLSGTMGADVVEGVKSNSAQTVIKQLETIQDTIADIIRKNRERETTDYD